MWWEVIPSGGIIMLCVAIPQFFSIWVNKVAFDHPYRRPVDTIVHRNMIGRDERVTGIIWRINGLDSLPDEPPKKK